MYNIKFFNRHKDEDDKFTIEEEILDKLMELDYDFEEKVHAGVLKQITKVKTQEKAFECLNKICDALKNL